MHTNSEDKSRIPARKCKSEMQLVSFASFLAQLEPEWKRRLVQSMRESSKQRCALRCVALESPSDLKLRQYLALAPLNKGVNLRLSTPVSLDSDAGEGGAEGNLFVCSNSLGYIVVGDNQGQSSYRSSHFGSHGADSGCLGFALHSLAAIRESISSASAYSTPIVAPQLHVPLNSRVDFIKLGDGETLLVVGCRDGSLGVWDLGTLITGNVRTLPVVPSP